MDGSDDDPRGGKGVKWREDASGGALAADLDCPHPFLVHELDRVVVQIAGLAVAAMC